MNNLNMFAFLQKEKNKYEQKYSRDMPRYPPKREISIRKTNEFHNPFYIKFFEDRIPQLKELAKQFSYIPDEIWSIILTFQMYLEKKDAKEHDDWLYSEYSKTPMLGMKLRTRQLYLPNIYGIVMNEGLNIVKSGERVLWCVWKKKDIEKKRIIENLSKYFLNYIVRWFHWLNKVTEGCNEYGYRESKFDHLIYTLKLKSKYFLEEVDSNSK